MSATKGNSHALLRLALGLCSIGGLFLCTCKTPPPPQVELFAATPGASPPTPATTASMLSEPVALTGAIGEVLSFQFAAPRSSPSATPLGFQLDSFRLANGSSQNFPAEFFAMREVNVDTFPGWHIRALPPAARAHRVFDVLVPLSPGPNGFTADAGSAQAWYWVDIQIPKGTDPGTYASQLRLMSGGIAVGDLPIQITVLPFVLPDDAPPPAIAELDHAALVREFADAIGDSSINPQYWHDHPRAIEINAFIHGAIRLLNKHRIHVTLPLLSPRVTMQASGDVSLDWRSFDALMRPVMSGDFAESRTPAPAIAAPLPAAIAAMAARPGAEMTLRKYFSQCARHFEEQGWLSRSYAIVPFGPDSNVSETARTLADIIETATASELPLATAMPPQDMEVYGWRDYPFVDLTDVIDVWLPPAQFFDPAVMSREKDRGAKVWFRVDRPPFSGSTSVHGREADRRAIPWQAALVHADAIFLGSTNGGSAAGYATNGLLSSADTGALVYAGGEFGRREVLPSVRLKQLRRGLQDLAYLRLLSDHGLSHVGRTVTQSLVTDVGAGTYRAHFADGGRPGWSQDPQKYELARAAMAEQLMRKVQGDDGSEADFAQSVSWSRLMQENQRIDLRVQGLRLRPVGAPSNPEAEVLLSAAIANNSRLPISGSWSGGPAELRLASEAVPTLPPRSSRGATLTARANLKPVAAKETQDFSIDFVSQTGETWSTSSRLALATAGSATSPIRIDGDLSDWPTGSSNTFGDFLAVSPGQSEERRASQKTTAYVLRDDRAIYFAINCEAKPATAARAARKGVHYDDLVPLGEELVEILIDPLNLGTRDPADLYHIVIKRSGADLIEKGIGFDPPWSPRSTWAADVDIASMDQGARWVAEVRIPLEAFGPGPHRREIWGLNITRFDLAGQEFSTWSGAVGNPYDPLSLGNLYLP